MLIPFKCGFQAEVTERLNNVIESLLGDLKTLYETLWESPFNTQHLRTMLLPGMFVFNFVIVCEKLQLTMQFHFIFQKIIKIF